MPFSQRYVGNHIPLSVLALTNLTQGDKVIATARSRDKSALERLALLKAAGASVMEIDVTTPAEVLNAKAKEAWSIYGHVDVLVNNAAYIDAGIFEETEYVPIKPYTDLTNEN
jgi:NAD(P)-dependent dehydrogenase (short-subunit alcohol dehydrogenase family)